MNRIKEDAKTAPLGILPEGKSMDNYVGYTVINLSDVTLTIDQVEVPEETASQIKNFE